tara:strand:- start:6139 stop:7107 length:969 start_codon:yes stop_codon:yes gene_type:complete
MVVYTGGSASVKYGYETTFGTGVAAVNPFGMNQKVTNLSLSNTRMSFNKLGQVETTAFAYGQQVGNVGISFVYDDTQSHKIFQSIYGAIQNTNTTYPLNANQGSATVLTQPITTEIAVQMGTSVHKLRELTGCVVNSISMSTSIGEPLNGSIDMSFGKEVSTTIDGTGAITAQDAGEQVGSPFTFAHGSFKLSDGSALQPIGEIQDADINWTQNSELLYGVGSHYAQGSFKKTLDISGKFKTAWKDSTMVKHILDQAKSTGNSIELGTGIGIELLFTSGSKTMKIELNNIAIGDYSVTGIEPVEPIFEDISWKAKTALITVS